MDFLLKLFLRFSPLRARPIAGAAQSTLPGFHHREKAA
jgi:hypothetical protein